MNKEKANVRLKPLCCKEETRYDINEPFGYEENGTAYAAATDGHLLVLLEVDEPLDSSDLKLPPLAPILTKYSPNASNTFTVSLERLKEFASLPACEAECAKCDGFGYCTHCQEDCADCDGEGTFVPEMQPGRLGRVLVDRVRLARQLAAVPDSVKQVEVVLPDNWTGEKGNDSSPVFITAAGFRAALMPMRLPNDKEAEYPVFEVNS